MGTPQLNYDKQSFANLTFFYIFKKTAAFNRH